MSSNLACFKVVTDINMIEQKGLKEIKKTLKERLCWDFWRATKLVPNIIPMKVFIVHQELGILICYPSMKEILEKHIETLI